MKPDWDKLIDEYKDHPHALIADVDCTAGGKPICELQGVPSFPTLKWGSPTDLQDYEGARGYDDLKAFAEENLKPMCSVANVDICDAETKAQIEGYKALAPKDLAKKIKKLQKKIKKANKDFNRLSKKVQKESAKVEKKKGKAETELKAKHSELSVMKMVMSFRKPVEEDADIESPPVDMDDV